MRRFMRRFMRNFMRRSLASVPGLSLAAVLAVLGIPWLAVTPILAQTAAGVLEGRAAFGDWRSDRPGLRRLIKPHDLPPPQPAESAANMVRVTRRAEQKPAVPSGFTVDLFASGLAGPRIIRAAPNGDIF